MRAILINVDEAKVEVVSVEPTLGTLQQIVGGLIASFDVWGQSCIYNDDGVFSLGELKGRWTAEGFCQHLVGNSLLLGPPDAQGNSTDCTLSVESVERKVKFIKTKEPK